MPRIFNPILPGFHPDPCMIRVGRYFYIATSTFEWWPGVQIHRSRDLGTWSLVGHALTRRSQLEMRGNPDSGGVWAPGLSHADGQFWLVYSDVKALHGPYKDVRNYLVTSRKAEGPWSEPIPLNRSGFDPSLFHDADGRKWLLNQLWKPSVGLEAFDGIALQEYSVRERRLVGDPVNIFAGTGLGKTEGPHLYRRGGYDYLLTAEGGTDWSHAVSVARSRKLTGPYQVCPDNPLLTSASAPGNPLQKAGHGSLAETADGRWFLAHLCSRPLVNTRRCLLGRETALQPIAWTRDGWPRLAGGGREPAASFGLDGVEPSPYLRAFADEFERDRLDPHWSTLREPPDAKWLSLVDRPGFLRMRGRDSLQSLFDQSLVGFRLLHFHCAVSTRLEFSPRSYQQTAGLCLYYNTANFYYLYVTGDGASGRRLGILGCDNRSYREVLEHPVVLPPEGGVRLKATVHGGRLAFAYSLEPDLVEVAIGPELDSSILSDDYPAETGLGLAFTGAFAALCAQDSSALRISADFDWFHYEALSDAETPHRADPEKIRRNPHPPCYA